MTEDERFMREALRQAKKSAAEGEIPVGCVIVRDGEVIARGRDRRKKDASVLSHAEINAIRKACRVVGDWRLEGCSMYVTLEPCQMCSGAIVQARIPRLYIGAMNPKAGCAGSIMDLMHEKRFNHQVYVTHGLLAGDCSAILKEFFRNMRAGAYSGET